MSWQDGKQGAVDAEAEAMVNLVEGQGLSPQYVQNMQKEEGIWVSKVTT